MANCLHLYSIADHDYFTYEIHVLNFLILTIITFKYSFIKCIYGINKTQFCIEIIILVFITQI